MDFAENEARNRRVGRQGELLVVAMEREYLASSGRPDLVDQVRHVAEVEGDGAGYDVLSFDLDGREKFIEVKATRGGPRTPFIITPNELHFARLHTASFALYRIYNLDKVGSRGDFYVLTGDIGEQLQLVPTQFRARL